MEALLYGFLFTLLYVTSNWIVLKLIVRNDKKPVDKKNKNE